MAVIDTSVTDNGAQPPRKSIADLVATSDSSTTAEDDLVRKVRHLFMVAKARRQPLVARWNRDYRMLRNRYWVEDGRPRWMPAPQVPEIFPIVASLVGWMTDQKPTHTISPASVPNSDFDEWLSGVGRDLEAVMDASFHVNQEENQLTICCWNAHIYGTGFLKTSWHEYLAGGLGDASMVSLSPFALYPDPEATNMGDANFFIEAKRLPMATVDRLFPGARKKLKGTRMQEGIEQAPDQLGPAVGQAKTNLAAISPATSPRWTQPNSSNNPMGALDDHDLVDVLEYWGREHKVVDGHVIDEWRCVVVADNRVLMNEKASELWSHGSHPYSRFVTGDMGEFWGISLVELLTSPQEAINRILAAMQHNIELVGNPVWKDPVGSGLERQAITNRPGTRVPVNTATAALAGWINPPTMHQSMPDLVRYFLQRMEAVSGLSAIARGNAPQTGTRNAQGVMDSLQEATFVRVRMAQRQLEYTLRDAGYKKASLIIQNYDTPRMVQIAGPGGEKSSLALKARHFMVPTTKGAVPMEYQLLVDAGSRTHTSKRVREDQALALYGLGLIDDLAALQAIGFPNAREVWQRNMQQKAVMAPPGARQRTRNS